MIVAAIVGQLTVCLTLAVLAWRASGAAERLVRAQALEALVAAVEAKDPYTREHSERVALAAVMIARQIGLSDRHVEQVRYAGLLHDLGKLGVPTALLRKEQGLTLREQTDVARHPARGAELIADVDFLSSARDGIRHHHERVDGRGYPAGLTGGDIPRIARIVAIADAFDAMTSDRPYRAGRSVAAAVLELRSRSGDQFDPALVEAFVLALNAQGWPAAAGRDVDAAVVVNSPSLLPGPREPR